MTFFLNEGYRVIAHDRRGKGRSTQTATGNEMDITLAQVTGGGSRLVASKPRYRS